ncbi:MAG: hypothetical protein LBH06_10315 [Rikenellaceae bacterium]|nr:hypothetical protein [Rikenellaceae bacterium]
MEVIGNGFGFRPADGGGREEPEATEQPSAAAPRGGLPAPPVASRTVSAVCGSRIALQ